MRAGCQRAGGWRGREGGREGGRGEGGGRLGEGHGGGVEWCRCRNEVETAGLRGVKTENRKRLPFVLCAANDKISQAGSLAPWDPSILFC